jgi:asparaginyl-tRNA synthetase
MSFISIQEAINKAEGEVSVRGWCYRERKSANVIFIVLRDCSNIIQCVIDKGSKIWSEAQKVTIECSLELSGVIKKEPRAPSGYEILVKELRIIGESHSFPITKDQSPEFLLDMRHLWIRSRKLTTVMKIKNTILKSIRDFFYTRRYYEVPPPILTPNACEGGATLFKVKYYNDNLYLSQSWQLYAEALIFSLEKIFCVSPCFRAEKSKTSRHLSEFLMAEMEAAWYNLEDICKLSEELVVFIIKKVVEKHLEDLKLLGQNIEKLNKIRLPFPRITYTKALDLLKKDGVNIEWGKDLRTIEEDALMKYFDKPLIVTNYPKEIMAFYKPRDLENPKTALCFDMLAPEGYGEIIGGSQRDTDIDELKKSLKKEGEKIENYKWYLDLRLYGSVPHAGFGLGVERLVAWLCNLDNIKDTVPFPRTMIRYKP